MAGWGVGVTSSSWGVGFCLSSFVQVPPRCPCDCTHDLPRAEVVCIALRWAAAGAVVAISEAEPIQELVAEGWFAVEITGQRFGAARTFSKQQAEWLTMNREPVEAVGPLFDLFG